MAQDQYKTSINQSRTPAPTLQLGVQVFLSTNHIRTTGQSWKMEWKRLGSFPVTKVISPYTV